MIHLATVSAGVRDPSSTRLLADRIDTAVRAELEQAGIPVTSTVVELRTLGRSSTPC